MAKDNGYSPSIISGHDEHHCWLCGANGSSDPLNRHEIFYGPYRAKSKQLGLWVHLCHTSCHQGQTGVHHDHALDEQLKKVGQIAAMRKFGWSEADFIREFGKSHL